MSFTRKTLKILALIYFVLGIASLVIGIAGIATGKFESTYGSNAMLAAAVIIAKGSSILPRALRASRVPTSLRRLTARLSSVIVAASRHRLPRPVLTLPAFGGDAINFGAFVIVVYDLFFVQQAHAVKAENKDRL